MVVQAEVKKVGEEVPKAEEYKALEDQLQVQRDITNTVLQKQKVTDSLLSQLLVVVKDQQSQLVSLVGMFT